VYYAIDVVGKDDKEQTRHNSVRPNAITW